MTPQVMEKFKQRSKEAEARNAALAIVEGELISSEEDAPPKKTTKHNGLTSRRIIEEVAHNMTQLEMTGMFDSFLLPITKKNHFPTMLSRVNIFPAMSARLQKTYLDDDNAWPFDSPFGKGKRYGANLTPKDQCVLIAIFRLRSRRLIGGHGNLPIKVSRIFNGDEKGKIDVDVSLCTIAQILDELELSYGGKNYKDVLASLERLAACRIKMTVNRHDRYFGEFEQGSIFQLLDIQWTTYKDAGVIYVQFSPLVTKWLQEEATYLNWEIHKKLGRNENAMVLHIFLSSQFTKKKPYYDNEMHKIAKAVGIHGSAKEIKRKFTSGLKKLKAVGWIEDFELIGSGRKEPIRLHVWKPGAVTK